MNGDNLQFNTNDIPNHDSAYFGEDDSRYAEVPEGNRANNNSIIEQDITLTMPASPAVADSATETGMGPIGVAVNGVVFFNNEAAPGDSLEEELTTFDSYAGHPTGTGTYHYHSEPSFLSNDDDSLIGILLDGFPVFGRKCSSTGTYPTDLDENNGHTHDTGINGLDSIYHYHLGVIDGDGVDVPVVTGSYAGSPGNRTEDRFDKTAVCGLSLSSFDWGRLNC